MILLPAELAARERVATEALRWVGTPFHHAARVPGPAGGVDCAMLLAEVYERAGQIPRVTPAHYPHDWHLHRDVERYLHFIQRYAHETSVARRGDVVVFKIGRTFSHAGIIITWPQVVHAWFETGVERGDVSLNPQLKFARFKLFTLKEWK